MEMKYFRDVIEPKMESGEITDCKKQVLYVLLPAFVYKNKRYEAIEYRSDFDIYYADGRIEVIDIKGLAKPLDVAKRKLLLYVYPDIDFKWLVYSGIDGGWCEYDYVKKQRAKRKRFKETLKKYE